MLRFIIHCPAYVQAAIERCSVVDKGSSVLKRTNNAKETVIDPFLCVSSIFHFKDVNLQ